MNSADKHTPGPWHEDTSGFCDLSADGPIRFLAIEEWTAVCCGEPGGDDLAALAYCHPTNARLIAAAPDMLEALRMVLGALERFNDREDGAEDDLLYHLSNTLPDTIAKATGGAPC